jgi:hypothetical protein
MPAQAATETVSIHYLPMHEAASIARSQLSATGQVAVVKSRRLLILNDDQAHIKKATELLKRLDQMPAQYTAHVFIEELNESRSNGAGISSAHANLGTLPGGWLRVRLENQQHRSSNRQVFQLRVTANKPGDFEVGNIQPTRLETRQWLSGYGLIKQNSVELVPITSGFRILLWPAGENKVRVRLVPWMQRASHQLQGQEEMLLNLGSTNTPATPPSNSAALRLNASPRLQHQQVIELAGAATELTVAVGEEVTIAASNHEAEILARALLSRHSSFGYKQLVIHLRVERN